MLAYRIQVDAHGGFDLATGKFLERLARGLERRTMDKCDVAKVDGDEDQICKTDATSASTRRVHNLFLPIQYGSIKPGTIQVREHDGVIHRVMATGDGFAWNGTTYAGLSKVATAITGVNWSGPRFFGLLPKRGGDSNHGAGKSKIAPPKPRLSNRRTTEGHIP